LSPGQRIPLIAAIKGGDVDIGPCGVHMRLWSLVPAARPDGEAQPRKMRDPDMFTSSEAVHGNASPVS
jgi:hypothetical protein